MYNNNIYKLQALGIEEKINGLTLTEVLSTVSNVNKINETNEIINKTKSLSPGCSVQAMRFTKNGTYYFPGCSATTADNVGVEIAVSFDSSSVGQSYYCWFNIHTPSGDKSIEISPTPALISSAGTIIFSKSGVLTSGSNYGTGTYTIYMATIINSSNTSDYCYSTTAPGDCQSITYSTAVCTTTPPYGARYCKDASTICVWNTNTCAYDCQACISPYTSCVNGNCVQPPIQQHYSCQSNGCQPSSCTGGTNCYTTNNCDNVCSSPPGTQFYYCSGNNCSGPVTTCPVTQCYPTNYCNGVCGGGGGGGTCTSSTCDGICMSSTQCIPKLYLIGGAALFAMMMLMRR